MRFTILEKSKTETPLAYRFEAGRARGVNCLTTAPAVIVDFN